MADIKAAPAANKTAVTTPVAKEEKAKVVEPDVPAIERDRKAVAEGKLYCDAFEDRYGVKP